jgi:hypothetical protein
MLDGEEVSAYGSRLQEALLLSPTIFPILFAALMGRCFKYLGLYRAERGIQLGRLEQLVGCQSLFSALERQISIGTWSLFGLFLTLIWLFSPLGGQSALRLLDTEPHYETSTTSFHYLNPISILDSSLSGASAANSGKSTFTSIFLAALLSSARYQATPLDLWGNVKMPAYRSVAGLNNQDWKPIDHTKNITYASLIGIPIAAEYKGHSNFTMKARQWDITCSSLQELTEEKSNFGPTTATWKLNFTDKSCTTYPCGISMKSLDNAGNYSIAACELSYDYIEALINCNEFSCQADRLMKLDPFTDGYTKDVDDLTRSLARYETTLLPSADNYATADAGQRSSTNMEKWMADPWDFIGVSYDNVDLYKLSPELLAERLTILFNTFFQSTYASVALARNLPQNLTELTIKNPYVTFNETKAKVSREVIRVYKTDWRWLSALLVSSIILQIAAYTGLVLRYITLAPDIIGYASSLTLLNPFVRIPAGGTTLHGLEKAALLHDLKIQIGDVCVDEKVGAIAVATANGGIVGPLKRNKKYM